VKIGQQGRPTHTIAGPMRALFALALIVAACGGPAQASRQVAVPAPAGAAVADATQELSMEVRELI